MSMDYHIDGFRPGDPRDCAPASPAPGPQEPPAETDILIVGCGPAGLMLGAQLAQFSDLHTTIIDAKAGPIAVGQADGVSGRSLEIFEGFGFSNRVLEEAYELRAISFWGQEDGQSGPIQRKDKRADGRGQFSHFPHVVLNQARVHDFLLDTMAKAPVGLRPCYNTGFDGLLPQTDHNQPIRVRLTHGPEQGDRERIIETRYLVGCDGAHSAVRRAMGLELEGDSDNKAWGVMDLLLVTDFPDIRVKSLVESAADGTLMIIPREGGHLVRFYVELEQLAPGQRIHRRDVSLDQLISAAQRILQPYTLTVKEVPWWSVYEVGQRLCPVFDNRNTAPDSGHPNVFIVGDACHTHSPKAGQGMNVSMHDSFNLGWKLAAVARGHSQPKLLLSYSDERQTIARELIDFDRHLARLFSAAGDSGAKADKTALQDALLAADGFVSGTTSEYGPSATVHRDTQQPLAAGLTIGRRLPPLSLIRAVDARPLRLNEKLLADGRWRMIVFDRASPDTQLSSEFADLLAALDSSGESPLGRYIPDEADIDSIIELLAVLPRDYRRTEVADLPDLLWPSKGKLALRDYGKVFCPPDRPEDWYASQGIDHDRGCIVLARPDQHVAGIYGLNDWAALVDFFAGFMVPVHTPPSQ